MPWKTSDPWHKNSGVDNIGRVGGGDSLETVLQDYPRLTQPDIQAALQFASELTNFQESAYEEVA